MLSILSRKYLVGGENEYTNGLIGCRCNLGNGGVGSKPPVVGNPR
jgi:hypothetical protein